MQVIHVQADGVCSDLDVMFVELVIRTLEGVRKVASVASIGLISVLFDERQTSATEIVEAVRWTGLGAHEYQSAPAH